MLSKLLLHGEHVNDSLIDWETETLSLSSKLPCDVPSYLELSQMCFNESLASPLVASFTRSITLHHFTELGEHIKWSTNEKDVLNGLDSSDEEKRVSGLLEMASLKHKSEALLAKLAPLLNNSSNSKLQMHAIATTTTLSPHEIQLRLIPLLTNPQIHTKSEQDIHTLMQHLDEKLNLQNDLIGTVKIIEKLAAVESDDIAIMDKLVEILKDGQPEWREAAAKGLSKKAHLLKKNQKKIIPELKEALKKEKNFVNIKLALLNALSQIDIK